VELPILSRTKHEPADDSPKPAKKHPHIGWREWIALPGFGVETIKAKVDTGARTSSLHAFDLETFRRGRREMVRFVIHPEQRNSRTSVVAEAEVTDWRRVKASSGHTELRPVILATLELLGVRWEAELTLTRRDQMGFRMLLGRQAIRGRFVVDPGKSYLNGKRVKGTHRLSRKRGHKK
jgi:hypothetical protein